MTDLAMNHRRIRGDSDFPTVYRNELMRLVRVAHLITGSNAVAEEVVQEAFASAYRRWDQINDPAGYLYRSVVNGSRSILRRRRVEMAHRSQHQEMVLPPEIDEVWVALARIPIKRRTALVLRYYGDMTTDQIAEMMDVRPATVRSLIHRGQESLRKVLES